VLPRRHTLFNLADDVRFSFERRTRDLNGSLSGSARFTSLLTDFGIRSIFAANRPYWPHAQSQDLDET
jgi:hypothetical protein